MNDDNSSQETKITVAGVINYLFDTYGNKDKNKRDAYAFHFQKYDPKKLLQAVESVISGHDKSTIPTPAAIKAAISSTKENHSEVTKESKALSEAEQNRIIDSMLATDRNLTYKAFDIYGATVVINCYLQGYSLDNTFLYSCQLLEQLYIYFGLIPTDRNARIKRPSYLYQAMFD